jgi:SagB-type dehydrogenase family enzyme
LRQQGTQATEAQTRAQIHAEAQIQTQEEKVELGAVPRILRNPDLLVYWSDDGLFVKDLQRGRRMLASPELITVLDLFSRPRNPIRASEALPGYEAGSVHRAVRRLLQLGFLLPEKEGRRRVSRLKAWRSNVASAHYHMACRDGVYLERPEAIRKHVRSRVTSKPRPPRFKRYKSAVRRPLSRPPIADLSRSPFGDVLDSRRTVRRFSKAPVRLEDLSAVVGGTWGRTGWIDGGILGRGALKTSPSAGALHPIECYLLAWNVEGLAPGLYHYDVVADELRRLRAGDLRAQAVRAASGQKWIGRAAVLCVMTAVFTRTLWKYQLEEAYRDLWLDAGHLAQTFCLLATARGLGPFTTAAIQHTYIEKLIGLDGVKEFPIYLCGAGVPVRPLLASGR